jgi:hypothetical protein
VHSVLLFVGNRPMSIFLKCSCGQELQGRDQDAGMQVKCPACGTVMLLSSPALSTGRYSPSMKTVLHHLGYASASAAGAGQVGVQSGVRTVLVNLRRAFTWNLREISVSETEQKQFVAGGAAHPTLQRYLAWRRSVLLVVCLPAALLALVNMAESLADTSDLSGFGRLWLTLQILAPFAIPVTVVGAAMTWADQRLSRRLIVCGWVISFLGPILLCMVPAHWLIAFHDHDVGMQANAELGTRFVAGLVFFAYLCVILPVFAVSMAFGVQRACLRLKTLVPQSVVPGLFLTASAPIFPLTLLPFFVLVNQVASNWLLVLGMLLLMGSPVVFAIFFPLFTRPLLKLEDFKKVWIVQWFAKSLFWIGILLLVTYAMTRVWSLPRFGSGGIDEWLSGLDHKTLLGFSEKTSMFRPWSWRIIRWLVMEPVVRSLFTTVLAADLFMRVNQAVWRYSRELPSGPHADGYDHLMSVLDQSEIRQ